MTINDIIKILRSQIKELGKSKVSSLYPLEKKQSSFDLYFCQYIIQVDYGSDKVTLFDATEPRPLCVEISESIDPIFYIF